MSSCLCVNSEQCLQPSGHGYVCYYYMENTQQTDCHKTKVPTGGDRDFLAREDGQSKSLFVLYSCSVLIDIGMH